MAYVLAGGGSTRFGRDKSLVEFAGKPMLARMIDLMRGVTEEVKVVAAPGKYAEFGVTIVEDRWPGEGPLGGDRDRFAPLTGRPARLCVELDLELRHAVLDSGLDDVSREASGGERCAGGPSAFFART